MTGATVDQERLDKATLSMLGAPLWQLVEKLDGVVLVLPAGGTVFLRQSATPGHVDRIAHECEIAYDYPDGKNGRRVVSRVKVKETT